MRNVFSAAVFRKGSVEDVEGHLRALQSASAAAQQELHALQRHLQNAYMLQQGQQFPPQAPSQQLPPQAPFDAIVEQQQEAWAWQAHQQPATAGGASGSGAWPAETWQAAAQAPPVAAAAGQQPAEAPVAALQFQQASAQQQ